MIQLIPNESPSKISYLNKCLGEIKDILYFHQQGVVDSEETFRIGKLVLMPITGRFTVYGHLSDTLDKDNYGDFIKILKAELRYYTGYLYQSYDSKVNFSLYPAASKIEDYYLEQGYLAMQIGAFDKATYSHYESKITKFQ